MKGVSAVIATLLMLIITIGLAGVAFTYFSGMITTTIYKTISITSADCTANTIFATVRNDGTDTINIVNDLRFFVNNVEDTTPGCSGNITSRSVAVCNTLNGSAGSNKLTIVGPSNTPTATVFC